MVINNHHSDWADVVSGIPQGSVLGPLLFIIFINDLGVDFLNALYKFADNTKVLRCVSSEEQIYTLRQDLEKLQGWS